MTTTRGQRLEGFTREGPESPQNADTEALRREGELEAGQFIFEEAKLPLDKDPGALVAGEVLHRAVVVAFPGSDRLGHVPIDRRADRNEVTIQHLPEEYWKTPAAAITAIAERHARLGERHTRLAERLLELGESEELQEIAGRQP